MEYNQSTILKYYRGDEKVSRRIFDYDAVKMMKQGYYPVSQIYTPGSWSGGSFIIAVLLVVIFIGIIALFYMLIVKPDGQLTVTYELREEEKKCPMCAEKVKYAAKICKHCRHEFGPNENINKTHETEIKTLTRKEIFIRKAKELKTSLKDDEIIIAMKNNQDLKIIKKSKYEADKNLRLSKNYVVVDKN